MVTTYNDTPEVGDTKKNKGTSAHIKTSLSVIERNEKGYVEWGLSFNGYDPSDEDYFKMSDEKTAFRLLEKLSAKYPPISFDNPVDWSPKNNI